MKNFSSVSQTGTSKRVHPLKKLLDKISVTIRLTKISAELRKEFLVRSTVLVDRKVGTIHNIKTTQEITNNLRGFTFSFNFNLKINFSYVIGAL